MIESTTAIPHAFVLSTDSEGRLILNRPGLESVVDVRVRRSFPWSDPDRFISIRDSKGKELLLIEDQSKLSPAQRQAIASAIRSSSFMPRITHVEHVDTRFGFQQWKVITDRGPAEFRVQEREDIRFMPDGRITIKDADGNIYELGDPSKLNDHSRRAVEALI